MQSDTPRTDEELKRITSMCDGDSDDTCCVMDQLGKHARVLERELAAAIKERDALQQRVEYMKALNSAAASIISERDALQQRVAELESQNPSDCEVIQAVMMNRDAELRLTCSALTGIYAHLNRVDDPVRNGQTAAAAAKAALDALSQPRAWRTCDPVRDLCGDPDSDLDGEALAAMRKGVARE